MFSHLNRGIQCRLGYHETPCLASGYQSREVGLPVGLLGGFQTPLLAGMSTFRQFNGAHGATPLASIRRRLLSPCMDQRQEYIGGTSDHTALNLCCQCASVISSGYVSSVRKVPPATVIYISACIHIPKVPGKLRSHSRQTQCKKHRKT